MSLQPGAAPLTRRSPRVVAVRKLLRRRDREAVRRFLAEGQQAVREALSTPHLVIEVYATSEALRRHAVMLDSARVVLVSDDALTAVSETVNSQGLVAVCAFLDVPLERALVGPPPLVALLAEVRDPGNAGTVLRTADAAGARAVVFAGDAVDPYNGKCVRASAGSVFHLDLVRGVAPSAAISAARNAGLRVYAADAHGAVDLEELDRSGALKGPTAWLFGSEAHGLPADLAATADAAVRVPMRGRAESLNLGAAAAICLYASARAQRT